MITATDDRPDRNLSAQAKEEFADISYRALAELCLDRATSLTLATQAKTDSSLLIDLCAVVEQYDLRSLRHAIEKTVGQPWRKAYRKALEQSKHWRVLPAI